MTLERLTRTDRKSSSWASSLGFVPPCYMSMNRTDRLIGGKLFMWFYFEYVYVQARDGIEEQRTESVAEALK